MSYKTKPRSISEIRKKANMVRAVIEFFTQNDGDKLNLLKFIEHTISEEIDDEFSFIICSESEMKDKYGLTNLKDNTIEIREDVYYRACDGNCRDIFTIAHELGHYFLHSKQKVEMARSSLPVKAYENPEWQANVFAAELLMPLNKIKPTDTPFSVAKRFGVSYAAAEIRLKNLKYY